MVLNRMWLTTVGLIAIALAAWLAATASVRCALAADQDSPANTAAASATNPAAGAAEQAPAEGPPNPLQWKTDLAVWTLVVFLVLFAVLWKFAWGPISEALDKREHYIAENIEAARRRDEEAAALLAEYERKLAGAADQVRAMLDEARHDAERTKQEIVAEARTAAQAEHERAMRDIRTAADAAVEELSQRSANLAVELAGKVISVKLTAEERSWLVKDSLSKFGAAAPSRN